MSRRPRRLFSSLVLSLALPAVLASPGLAEIDWPTLRGPNADGTTEGRLFGADAADGQPTLELAWKVDLGSGYSSVVVGQDRVITMFADGDADYLGAYAADSGKELWRYRVSDTYTGHDGSHDGPISTPLLTETHVYGLGAWGDLFALDVTNGNEVWKTHLKDDHGGNKPHYGFSTSPILVDGTLIVQIGAGEGKSMAGFDASNGEVKWTLGDDEIHYHSPVTATLAGQQQVLAANTKYLYGIDPSSGEAFWSYEHGGDDRAMGGATIIPLPAGEDRIYILNKIDSSAMLQVTKDGDAWNVSELWSNNVIKSSYVNPVYYEGHIYGISGRILTCLDAATGERKWRSRKPGDGFPTVVGDKLVIITKPGSLHVAEASPESYDEIAALELFDDHSWSEVAYSKGSLYARSMASLARIDAVTAGADGEGDGASWLASTTFGAFLAELESADDKKAAIDAYLAEQSSFPIIDAGAGSVHFVYRGEADDVGIVGDLIGFRREDPMTRVSGTDFFHYSMRVEPDVAATYGFLPDHPDDAVADPMNDRKGAGLFGEVSFFSMPAWNPPIYAHDHEAQAGTVEDFEWESTILEGAARMAKVYLPAGYADSGERRYPTLYVHSGNEAFENGEMTKVLDHAIGHSVDPVIVVFIYPDAENPRADQQAGEKYGQMIAGELIPGIDGKYRTHADRNHRATSGSGRGATQALFAALAGGDTFGKVAAQGPMFIDPNTFDGVLGDGSNNLVIHHSWGTYHMRSPHEAWNMVETNRVLWQKLRDTGYRPSGGEFAGGFGWSVWGALTDDWLSVLFPRTQGTN